MVPNRLSLLLRYEQLLDKFGMDFSRRENPDRNQLVADTTSFINSVSMKEKFASHTFIRLLKSSSELELFRPDLQSECFRVLEAVVVSRLYPWTYEFDAILTYSPFYCQKLSKCLVGVEEIFLQSDYELNEAKAQWICRKNVKSGKELIELAFDCFIASLECTAIDDLYQLAIASGTPITGSQIWASRSTNIGAPEVSVNRLLDSSTGYQTDLISLSPSSTDRFPPRNITMIDVDYPNYSTSSVVTPKSKPPVFMPLAHPHSAPIYYQPMRSAQEIHQRIRSFKTPLVQLHNSASNDLKQMQVRQCRHCQMESRQPLICEFCSQLL